MSTQPGRQPTLPRQRKTRQSSLIYVKTYNGITISTPSTIVVGTVLKVLPALFGPVIDEVCVIKYNQREKEKTVSQVIPVAGTFPSHSLDAKTTLLKSTGSEQVEGVRVELHGDEYRDQRQSTIIELSCDHDQDVIPNQYYASLTYR